MPVPALPPVDSEEKRVLLIAQHSSVALDRRPWQAATELARHGYIVSLICPASNASEALSENMQGVTIYRYKVPVPGKAGIGKLLVASSSMLWKLMLACRIFFTHGFDIVHVFNPPNSVWLLGGFFKLFFNKKLLFDYRVAVPALKQYPTDGDGSAHKMDLWWEKHALKSSDTCIASHAHLQTLAISRGNISEGKIFVVQTGVASENISSAAPKPAKHKASFYTVGCIGSHVGIQRLIEIARIIVHEKKRTDIYFHVTGDEYGWEGLKKLAAIEGVTEYVRFFAPDLQQGASDILRDADICVNLDAIDFHSDIISMSRAMEYMAQAKPMVHFDVPEIRASLQDASLYTEIHNTAAFAEIILTLLADLEKRDAMTLSARALVKREYAWEMQAPKLLMAYASLFNHSKAG